MKTKVFSQVLLVIASTCLLVSCTSGTTSSQSQQKEESFWEGQVKPGTYTGSWKDYIDNGIYNQVECTLKIYDDKTVKYKEITNTSSRTFIEVSTGTICKHVETYDGERKVWYGINTHPEPGSRYARHMNLSTSLEFSPGDCETYQEFNSRRGKQGYLKVQ